MLDTVLRPRRLAAGHTVGLVSPGSPANSPDVVRGAIALIESLGYRVKPGEHLSERHGYLAGTDEARAADLNAMFADTEVDAIFSLRGGYGCSRLLPLLDYQLIQSHPKILLGYSDVTALLNGIFSRTGLITFHGPVAYGNLSSYAQEEMHHVMVEPLVPCQIGAPPRFLTLPGRIDWDNQVVSLVPGKVTGRLVGGNLSMLTHLIGTPYMPNLKGSILFLEDVNEHIYRLDRMLTQLWLSGLLAGVAGLAFGKFANCTPSPGWLHGRPLEEVLAERCRQLNIPAAAGLMIGHIDEQTVAPIGCLAELDAGEGRITLLEPAVS